MIASSIISTIAAKEGLRSQLIELDYVLSWILITISESAKIKNTWVFKGGTALRKIYFPTWRYSEDLDFTITSKYNSSDIEECINQLSMKIMDKAGIDLQIKNVEDLTKIKDRESIKIPLTYIGPLLKTAHPRSLSLDLTFDEPILTSPKNMIIKADYPDQTKIEKSILVYSLTEILTEKIRSIIQRREP